MRFVFRPVVRQIKPNTVEVIEGPDGLELPRMSIANAEEIMREWHINERQMDTIFCAAQDAAYEELIRQSMRIER